jgi:ubiquinone/menaquinone biosynthesis C-methylase UbiE
METDYIDVTEIAGDDVSKEQVARLCNRYYWAEEFCRDKTVVEVACGTGQGLGLLNSVSGEFEAGDFSEPMVEIVKNHYKDRIAVSSFDAQKMPFEDNSKDVIIIFEAIYYLPDFEKFIIECKRVLKDDGVVLISTANKDLFDFNPSPYSYKYFGVQELAETFQKHGFGSDFWGDVPVSETSLVQSMLRPVKKVAVALNLIPKSMAGKKLLKKIVFGGLVKMPAEITMQTENYIPPEKIVEHEPNTTHKVILCAARLM